MTEKIQSKQEGDWHEWIVKSQWMPPSQRYKWIQRIEDRCSDMEMWLSSYYLESRSPCQCHKRWIQVESHLFNSVYVKNGITETSKGDGWWGGALLPRDFRIAKVDERHWWCDHPHHRARRFTFSRDFPRQLESSLEKTRRRHWFPLHHGAFQAYLWSSSKVVDQQDASALSNHFVALHVFPPALQRGGKIDLAAVL